MAFVQFSKVSLAFGDRDILKDATVYLAAGSKAALAGANGSGKSTLMKVLAGIIEADSGERAVQKNARISYLPQSGIVFKGSTLKEEADRAFEYGHSLAKELDLLGDELKKEEYSQNDSRNAPLLEKYHEIQTELEESGWYRREALAEQVLLGLGFSQKDFCRPVSEFSGGWQMRIALAKVLLEKPDILLLDEPTNYLDIEARTWLEQWLQDFKGGFLIVSHDRYFLDVTVNEVYELFNGNLHRYSGNYSHYEEVRRAELDQLMANYELQQIEIKKLEDFIRRFGAKATKAAQAQERMKMLEKIERIEIPENLKKIHFSFPPAPHSGRLVLTVNNLSKTYPPSAENLEPNCVIKNLDFVLENGERLVVAGRNGAGKTTLLRIVAGHDPDYSGEVKLGAGVSIGYFSQDSAEQLQGTQTVLETIESEAPFELIPKVRDMLGAFLFRGDDVYKQVSVLSGGEKSRLALLKLLLRPVNLLILDEPTNHLDLTSKDVLLDALKDFGGTVLFVSHDRGFIENLATRVIELKPGSARLFAGDYRYYLERLAAEQAGAPTDTSTNEAKAAAQAALQPKNEAQTSQLSWEEEKRRKNEKKRLEREEEQLMNEISEAEEEKAALEAELALPAVYSDGAKSSAVQKKIEEAEQKIEKLNARWEECAAALEALS
ncbi:MAG: ABC-F family ATP-binding cassette domain-containing protein [Spirochaetaceae bacterium]|nr:ABC-F family ATP-binding cassette domain-containing protein [Spirochaetaceae bacterium]